MSSKAFGWALLALALSACSVSVFLVSPEPLGPTGATYRLQAESLARDLDLRYSESDRARFVSKAWSEREARVEVAPLALGSDGLRFHRPIPYSVLLAPFVVIAPERGPLVLNLVLLVVLALLMLKRLARDGSPSAPFWTLAVLFGTVTFAYVRSAWPDLFTGICLVAAYLLTEDDAPSEELPQMATARKSQGRLTARWLTVGALMGLVTLQQPFYGVLVVCFVVLAGRERVAMVAPAAAIGLALVLGAAWLAGGELFPGVADWAGNPSVAVRPGDELTEIAKWTERARAVEAPPLVAHGPLFLWNLAYLAAGRHVGLLLYFLPIFALVASALAVRRPIVWGGIAILLLFLLLSPFNFFGGPEALGNRAVVPLLLLVAFAVRPSIELWPAVAAGLAGLALILPVWTGIDLRPRELQGRALIDAVRTRLPFETSQRYLPAAGEAIRRGLLIRATNDGLLPGTRTADFVLKAGAEGSLMAAATGSLESLDFEFGPGAGSTLEVAGGEVADLLFRPDGGVTFRVTPNAARVRHPLWGSEAESSFYMLELTIPSASGDDLPFSVSARMGGSE